MQWYTGDTLYDTLLLVGFAYSLLVMVSSFLAQRLTAVDLAVVSVQKGSSWLQSRMDPDGTAGSDCFPHRVFHGPQC